MMKKAAFTTLGCKVNMYDTEAMMELFKKNGYEIVDFDEFADIYVINTCTVTNFGDKKSRQMIRRAKRQNPDSIVVAAGCYAQTASEEVSKIEGVNIVIGTKKRGKIVELVEQYGNENKVVNTVENIMKEHCFEPLNVDKLEGKTRAYIKIQEGCNRFCTYCIIPFARGPVRSRKPEDIISEIERLAKNGFKEIVLTGIHAASYGIDFGDISFIDIIKLAHEVSGIERIRFSSVEPVVVTDEFIAEIKTLPKVCRHFHLSLQSGCDKILTAMNRRYNKDEYMQAVKRIKDAFEDAALTTDIIVGFPGEEEEDFEESLSFAEEVGFAKIHSFPYSPKKGTAAAKFPNQVSNAIKNERSRRMIELSDRLNRKFLEKFKTKLMPVLFEREIKESIYEGHTSNYIPVRAESPINLENKTVDVIIGDCIGPGIAEGRLSATVQNPF